MRLIVLHLESLHTRTHRTSVVPERCSGATCASPSLIRRSARCSHALSLLESRARATHGYLGVYGYLDFSGIRVRRLAIPSLRIRVMSTGTCTWSTRPVYGYLSTGTPTSQASVTVSKRKGAVCALSAESHHNLIGISLLQIWFVTHNTLIPCPRFW